MIHFFPYPQFSKALLNTQQKRRSGYRTPLNNGDDNHNHLKDHANNQDRRFRMAISTCPHKYATNIYVHLNKTFFLSTPPSHHHLPQQRLTVEGPSSVLSLGPASARKAAINGRDLAAWCDILTVELQGSVFSLLFRQVSKYCEPLRLHRRICLISAEL